MLRWQCHGRLPHDRKQISIFKKIRGQDVLHRLACKGLQGVNSATKNLIAPLGV